MSLNFSRSARLFEACRSLVPAGVNSNTRSRAPHPLYFQSANGGVIVDVDGNRFTDILMGNGAIFLGHNHPVVQDAVREALSNGLTTGVESAASCQLAEQFLEIVPTMDMVRFTNTGTEAVLHALRLARFATGRKRVAKTEGSYHGWSDEAFISVWSDLSRAGPPENITPLAGTPGQRPDIVSETVVLPFNDVERSIAAIDRHAGELAAVILEPILIDIGFIPATREYLQALRAACDRHGIVLIFDELLTAFNAAQGGVQGTLGVVPDLATFGKALGNGYPIAALAGKEALMRKLEPGAGPVFVGTFNGHAVPLAAARAALGLLADGSVRSTVSGRLQQLIDRFHESARETGVRAVMRGGGGHFHWYFTNTDVVDYRSASTTNAAAYKVFVQTLFEHSTLFLPNPLSHHMISYGHDDATLSRLSDTFRSGLRAVARHLDSVPAVPT